MNKEVKKNVPRKSTVKKDNRNDTSIKNEAVVKKESAIKEIIKEKKVKKAIPMRAKNDPRQKN